MNLSLGDIPALPLSAALFGGEDLLAATPEWRGTVAGTVSYPVRRTRLIVAPAEARGGPAATTAALLEALRRATGGATGRAALELRMVGASLGLVAGCPPGSAGTAEEVIDLAVAGISRRTGLATAVELTAAQRGARCPMPEVAALVLVQLAVNAERHDDATRVSLQFSDGAFRVGWQGHPAAVRTSRRRGDRERWGLGFARLAADSLGATLHLPVDRGSRAEAVLEVGVPRLALPLARIRGATVAAATRTWDEETGLVPGCTTHRSARLGDLAAAARAVPGEVVTHQGWTARATGTSLWVALPPAG
ncbi:MAG: hypothetical protein JOZ92_00970, partial [Candidatus Dormibacteraeota bacterium]|nr:hypothetical protein [Candidatus Dormibacteraeota bacterium]